MFNSERNRRTILAWSCFWITSLIDFYRLFSSGFQESTFRNLLFRPPNTKFHRCLGIFFLINSRSVQIRDLSRISKRVIAFVIALIAVTQNKKKEMKSAMCFLSGGCREAQAKGEGCLRLLCLSLPGLAALAD